MNADLSLVQKKTIIAFICNHSSNLAWKPAVMLVINLNVMTHELNVFPNARVAKQKKRAFGSKKQEATR